MFAVGINVPVVTTASYGIGIEMVKCHLDLVVFQRCVDDHELFSISGDIDPGCREVFLLDMNQKTSFVNLEKLLKGETLMFVNRHDEHHWVEISLDQTKHRK